MADHQSIVGTPTKQCCAIRMKHEKKIDADNIRIDTTVVETNIHYPTDSSLLWDTYRVIDRIWTQALDLGLSPVLPAPIWQQARRLHPEKIRKLHLDIVRFSSSKYEKRKQLVKSSYDTLIERTEAALSKAKQIAACLKRSTDVIAMGLGFALESYFPAMTKVVDAARRRHAGEMGHKRTMLYPGKDEFDGLVDDYDGKVKYFGVPGRLRDFGDALMSTFQRWRAGIEGTISCLKRAFRLSRCHFNGF